MEKKKRKQNIKKWRVHNHFSKTGDGVAKLTAFSFSGICFHFNSAFMYPHLQMSHILFIFVNYISN